MKREIILIVLAISNIQLFSQTATWEPINIDAKEYQSKNVGDIKISLITNISAVAYKTKIETFFCRYDDKMKRWDSTDVMSIAKLTEGLGNMANLKTMFTNNKSIVLLFEKEEYTAGKKEWNYGIAYSENGTNWYGGQFAYHCETPPGIKMVDNKILLFYNDENEMAKEITKIYLNIPNVDAHTNAINIEPITIKSNLPLKSLSQTQSNTNKIYLFDKNKYYASSNYGVTWNTFGNAISANPYFLEVKSYGDTILYTVELPTKTNSEMKFYYSLNGGQTIKELIIKKDENTKALFRKIGNKFVLILNDKVMHYFEVAFKNGNSVINEKNVINTEILGLGKYNRIDSELKIVENNIYIKDLHYKSNIYYKLNVK